MTYTPIAKIEKFTGKENDTLLEVQLLLENVNLQPTDSYNIQKKRPKTFDNNTQPSQPMDEMMTEPFKQFPIFYKILLTRGIREFKTAFLGYFSNNNSINHLANIFTTIKQGETKAFIHELHNSLFQCVHPMHPQTLQNTITNVRDFELAELEANHAQVINLVMNRSSELDFKLKQLTDNYAIYQPPQQCNNPENMNCFQNHRGNKRCMSAITVVNKTTLKLTADFIIITHDWEINIETLIVASNLLTNNICYLSTTVPTHISAVAPSNLSIPPNSNTVTKITSKWNPKAETDTAKLEIVNGGPSTDPQFYNTTIRISTMEFRHQNYLSLLVTPEDTQPNNPETNKHPTLTNNIPSAIITKNKLLDAIFPFELEELSITPLFSGTTLEEKPITAMYTDAKVDGHAIKLILDNGSVGSIITKQLMDQLGHRVDHTASTRIITANGATKTPIGEIDDFPIEVNDIIVPIKVLVMEAT
ncbi:hypothetical protein G9A89_014451 [Geosiphon pyriformis]|nr:hypothetical protein G9A89_014451 [Geosiphon pyriformis]